MLGGSYGHPEEERHACVPHQQYLAIVGRRVVETVGSILHNLFPRRIYVVVAEGFVLEDLHFVFAHNLNPLSEKSCR